MNKSTTKVKLVNDTPTNTTQTEMQRQRQNQDKEIHRKIAKHRDIFKGSIGTDWNRQIYNSSELLAMAFGAETWTITNQAKNKLAATHTVMEKNMLNITYRDRKTIIWVLEKTKFNDAIEQVRRRKWTCAGHVSRIRDNRWSSDNWKSYERKRLSGRPARRWRDKLDDYWKGTTRQKIAQDRQMWKQHAEAFGLPRDTMAAK